MVITSYKVKGQYYIFRSAFSPCQHWVDIADKLAWLLQRARCNLGGKKKIPEDMDLFRSEVDDVRPLTFEKRVPSQTPRAHKKNEPAVKAPSGKIRCPGTPGKKMYETLKEATVAAGYVRQEWRNTVRPYECEFCGKYHLTSK